MHTEVHRFTKCVHESQHQNITPGKLFSFSVDAPQHSCNKAELSKSCAAVDPYFWQDTAAQAMRVRGQLVPQSPIPVLFDWSTAWCSLGRGAWWDGDSVYQDKGKATIPFHTRQCQIPYAATLFQLRVFTVGHLCAKWVKGEERIEQHTCLHSRRTDANYDAKWKTGVNYVPWGRLWAFTCNID